MPGSQRQYACIDLKIYYASVECVDRDLDPLTTNLVVADESRSDGTICLAVSPSLKALGVPGRPRLFEVKERLAQIKATTGKTVEYITAMPRMARYLEVSSQIYGIYLKYLAAQDIHVYSIDEAFMDLTPYLSLYGMTAHELVVSMIREVLRTVGIKSQDILHYIDTLEHSTTEMHGLMIMRHGKICTEGWWAPYAPNLCHGLQSHTKTYAATAVGIAYTQGILKLDERLIDIFPEESSEEPSENLKKLKVRDVLCMGCGMDEMPRDSEHWIRDFLHIPVNHEPGTTFMYNSVGSTMLGAIVRKKTGKGLHEFLTENLFLKIGIDPSNLRWYCMADGMETGGGGLLATLEDNLRLMKLYADGGVWEGERILAEDYVKLATSLQNESATESINNPEAFDNFLGYGFQIWMCKPEGVYRADGAMGQFTIVCPKQDMIISITETAVGAHWAQNTLDLT